MGITPERWKSIVRGEARGLIPALWRRALWIMRGPYAVGVWWRNRRFDRGRDVHRVSVPVISIGNVTVGGTGKTPCVEWVGKLLRDRDVQVAILSRGYGSVAGRNDEAMVLEENLPDVPHLQDRDRVALAHTAIDELESEVLVLDDGFQHRRLARDLDVVLIDASDPWMGGYLLPRGGLREPKTRLNRAHAIVLTRCDTVSPEQLSALEVELSQLVPGAPIARAIHAPIELANGASTKSPTLLSGQTVGAFCGLGNPAAFRRTLEDLGAQVIAFQEFPDHHAYQRADVEALQQWAALLPANAWVVTSQKDWVKIRAAELGGRPLWSVRVGLQFIAGQEAFEEAIWRVVPTAATE